MKRLKTAGHILGYFAPFALLLIPNDLVRMFVLTTLIPGWAVTYLHLFVKRGGE